VGWRQWIHNELNPSHLNLGLALGAAGLWITYGLRNWMASHEMLPAIPLASENTFFWIAAIGSGAMVFLISFESSLAFVSALSMSAVLGFIGHDSVAKALSVIGALGLAVVVGRSDTARTGTN
jgi:hypothetical protein